MNKLILVIALSFSLAANAEKINAVKWVNNDRNIPVVQSSNNSKAFILISGCERPVIAFHDFSIVESDLPFEVSGKVRIDSKQVRPFKADFIWSTVKSARLALQVDNDFIDQLKRGHTLRVQWPSDNGGLMTEEYSLKGFTRSYNKYHKECGIENKDWFKTKIDGNDYFAGL